MATGGAVGPIEHLKGKYTDETAHRILELLSSGVPAKHAAEACGIDESTYWRWRQRGRSGEEPFTAFDSLAREASARWPIPLIDAIRRAAPDDWRAAAWMLERRDPENWGRREKVEHSGLPPANTLDLSKLSDDQIRQIIDILQSAQPSQG